MPETPHTDTIEVSLRIGMSPDAFRSLQDEFVRDFAALLGCDPSEIKILGIHPAHPETSGDFINAAQLQALGKRGLTEY